MTAMWPEQMATTKPRRTVQITGIENIDEETLELLFSNKRKTGGGPIEDIALKPQSDKALITFASIDGALL